VNKSVHVRVDLVMQNPISVTVPDTKSAQGPQDAKELFNIPLRHSYLEPSRLAHPHPQPSLSSLPSTSHLLCSFLICTRHRPPSSQVHSLIEAHSRRWLCILQRTPCWAIALCPTDNISGTQLQSDLVREVFVADLTCVHFVVGS